MDKRLQPISIIGSNFNVIDHPKFEKAIKLLKESVFDGGATLYCSDNLITWNKNLSFVRDPFFRGLLQSAEYTIVEKSIVWRSYILLYFAEIAAKLPGDFIELGCHTGTTASLVLKKIDLNELNKKYYLYDLFEWNEGDEHTRFEAHNNPRMYEDVLSRFADKKMVRIIKGNVPKSFKDGFPDKIAFAHIDMNQPRPEAEALELILPRLSIGGIVILDDYGWWGYSQQKIALDPIVNKYSQKVLELPTGQAVLIKV